MKKKSTALNILLWLEVIVAARVLFFVIPVLINKHMTGAVVCSVDDWFIKLLAIPAFLYFIVGVVTLLGNNMWKMLHYLVVGVTLILTAALVIMVSKTQNGMSFYYFIPAVVSVLLILGIIKFDSKSCCCNY